MKRLIVPALLAVVALGCNEDGARPTADQQQSKATAILSSQAQQQVGMPGTPNFTERKNVKTLYELRDQNIGTHTYIMDMQGRLWFLCDSLGYGLPYGVQFTNPENLIRGSGTPEALIGMPQPEPNGLFMPPTADGTWVLCVNKEAGHFDPVYVEPHVIVSPFRLHSAGSYLEGAQ